jgi:DNA-binding transcriptional MerR regulator
MGTQDDLDLSELATAAGVTPRTVRYYVQQGLLPSPGTRGPGTRYDRTLLDRLHLIRRLQKLHWPLSKIRDRLESLDDEGVQEALREQVEYPPSGGMSDSALKYVRGLLEKEGGPNPAEAQPAAAARFMGRVFGSRAPQAGGPQSKRGLQVTKSNWERIRLTNDVELNIRRPLSREDNKRVDRLLEAAKDIFSEEA